MFNTKTALIVLSALVVIVLCLVLAVGASTALFSDKAEVTNHLEAGTLDIELWRTDLEYAVYDVNGNPMKNVFTDDVEISGSDVKNAFGIDSESMIIAPTSYFDADLEIRNKGNVSFDYSVEIKLLDTENTSNLANQIKVTVTKSDGTSTSYLLSELSADTKMAVGTVKGDSAGDAFSVKVEFLDLAENDSAKGETAKFDLIVTATQSTASNNAE